MEPLKWIQIDEMILKIMSSKYWNHYWHGYEALGDTLRAEYNCNISEKQIRFRVKAMRIMGKLETRPTFNESTGLLNGSGYFIPNNP